MKRGIIVLVLICMVLISGTVSAITCEKVGTSDVVTYSNLGLRLSLQNGIQNPALKKTCPVDSYVCESPPIAYSRKKGSCTYDIVESPKQGSITPIPRDGFDSEFAPYPTNRPIPSGFGIDPGFTPGQTNLPINININPFDIDRGFTPRDFLAITPQNPINFPWNLNGGNNLPINLLNVQQKEIPENNLPDVPQEVALNPSGVNNPDEPAQEEHSFQTSAPNPDDENNQDKDQDGFLYQTKGDGYDVGFLDWIKNVLRVFGF